MKDNPVENKEAASKQPQRFSSISYETISYEFLSCRRNAALMHVIPMACLAFGKAYAVGMTMFCYGISLGYY